MEEENKSEQPKTADVIEIPTNVDASVRKINITLDLKTGALEVGGHINDTNVCNQMLIEAGHILQSRNAKISMEKIADQKKGLETISEAIKNKENVANENTPPAATN